MRPLPTIAALLMPLVAGLIAAAGAVAAPSCDEGPETVGRTIVGTPCADTIRAPRSVTTVLGEGGDDTLYGGRGNDGLHGGTGSDRLYGGIGDDELRGGADADRLSGGFGADSLDGEAGGDFVRGDATIDAIFESGSTGVDILSYATGATPGFTNTGSLFDYEGFPGGADGRGVYIDLVDESASDGNGFANNGLAPAGGGVDLDLEGTEFETVIGTPFPDFIVGSPDAETIYGGGGADVLLGEGGADQLHGGAEGDSCSGSGATIDCERSDDEVEPRDPETVTAGLMAPPGTGPPGLYLTGSDGDDAVVATYSGAPLQVTFSANGSPAGTFPLAEPPDSVLLAGLAGDDTLTAVGFPETTSVILLGGEGEDDLTSGGTEDALVDGPGADAASAGGGDDALPNNSGGDELDAGSGEDLFVSNAICDGDSLDGGPDRDNANWANFDQAVTIDMSAQAAGLVGPANQAQCPSTSLLTELVAIEDVEGSGGDDTLVGDGADNQLLGRTGHDSYFAAAGNDLILGNSGDDDLTIDCGEGFDTALVDHPQYGDPAPIECESIEARNPNSFRPPDTPPDPDPEPETPTTEQPPTSPPPPRPLKDSIPPATRILHRPSSLLFTAGARRRVVFAFASEGGARFLCRLDRGPYRRCRSPRAYLVLLGSHVFRVIAIDAAGNRDASPAIVRFRVRRR